MYFILGDCCRKRMHIQPNQSKDEILRMKQYLECIKKHIADADMIVVGLGEEWNISPEAQAGERYQKIMAELRENLEYQWILPYVYYKLTDESLRQAYTTLFAMLENKNYFVVATTVNRSFIPFAKDGRTVMPCGNDAFMCDAVLKDITACVKDENTAYGAFIHSLDAYVKGEVSLEEIIFVHDCAGEVIPFNSVYAAGYREDGYLQDWSRYMSWLQGTMNRKTCLLELGSGMQFPSVFRFPFEKMAYFNQKAFCFRVHKSLYHLTEEMAERSMSVPVHSVELFCKTE